MGLTFESKVKAFKIRRLWDKNLKIVICYAEAWNVFFIILYYCHVMYVTSTKKYNFPHHACYHAIFTDMRSKINAFYILLKEDAIPISNHNFFSNNPYTKDSAVLGGFGRSMGCLLWIQRLGQLRPLSLSTWASRISIKVLSHQYENSHLWI